MLSSCSSVALFKGVVSSSVLVSSLFWSVFLTLQVEKKIKKEGNKTKQNLKVKKINVQKHAKMVNTENQIQSTSFVTNLKSLLSSCMRAIFSHISIK